MFTQFRGIRTFNFIQFRASHSRTIAAAACLLAATSATQADLVAYEPFDYTANTGIAGRSGGTGWTALGSICSAPTGAAP